MMSGDYFLIAACELLIAALPFVTERAGSRCTGFGSRGARAQSWQCAGLVALWQVGFSQTKDQTSVPRIARWTPNH